MRQQIDLYEMIEKETANGKKFWSFKTNQKTINIFDKKIADKLSLGLGKTCEVETEIKNGYLNILDFYKVLGPNMLGESEYNRNERLRRITDCLILAYQQEMKNPDIDSEKEIEAQALVLYKIIEKINSKTQESINEVEEEI